MKKPNSIWLLTFLVAMLPATGRAQGDCLANFKAELDALTAQYAELDKQSTDLRNRSRGRSRTDADREEEKAIEAKRHALREQKTEVDARLARCMGLPATEAEAKQRVSDTKARIAEQEQEWQAKAKKYENMSTGPSSLAAGSGSSGSPGVGFGTEGLVAMPPMPDTASAPPTPSSSSLPPFGSGRTPQQRAAALAGVNAELDRTPYVLPNKANAPSKDAILKLAATRNASARKSFGPDDLSAYSRVVTWVPRFDGISPDANRARELSFVVSSVTNYLNKPQLVIALASAVFALDPQNTANANNLASAIVTAGERLHPGKAQAAQLVPYRKDAESCFLYALANSMKGDAWTDESLTAIINLGNLYIDMGKLDEARSLFQVARKQSPYSWDAALGMAAYFHAVNTPDKAVAILEDDDLDRPQILRLAAKHEKALEKNDDVPIGSPEELYEDRLKSVNAVPVATAADFMSQFDQSARNKMRYFVENLPTKGSFTAPSISQLTQYASLKAIASPQGISALKEFMQKLQAYSLSTFASAAGEQLKMLSRLGLNVNLGVDLDDVARNPQKYANSKNKPKAKVDKEALKANVETWRQQLVAAERDLATGKTGSLLAMAAEIDPFFGIVQVDPEDYADPMNVIMQKHNFAVLNRKTTLYNGYLYSVNKKTRDAFSEIVADYQRKISMAEKVRDAELEKLKKGSGAESALLKHAVHVKYFNTCNAAAEAAFGSATNVATVAYVRKIKPKAEAYYYDVIRHVGLISDPEVRDAKDAELRRSIYSALVTALNSVAAAHGSFKYHPEWECGCDLAGLLRQREAEEEARRAEENARLMRNKAAKAVFDSGELPRSTPLWKRLDDYHDDYNFIFVKARISPVRTVVEVNVALPLEGVAPELYLRTDTSEFTGAATYDPGIKLKVKAGDKVDAYVGLKGSISVDGAGVVKDWSVTAGTGLQASVKDTKVSIGGEITFGPNGVRDSDFSAGIKQDFKNQFGGKADVSFEASTKRGCSQSASVSQTLMGAKKFIDDAKVASMKGDKKDPTAADKAAAGMIPTDYLLVRKSVWPGLYKQKQKSN